MSQSAVDQARPAPLPGFLSTTSVPALGWVRPLGAWLLPGRWPFRVLAVLVVFAVQGLGLTVRFDTGSISESSETWARFFRIAPMLPRIGMTLLVLIPFLGRSRVLTHAQAFAGVAHEYRAWWIWWSGQWAAFAVLTVASMVLFGEGSPSIGDGVVRSSPGAVWTVVWIGSAVATCVCFLFALAPPTFWCRIAVMERWVLLAGLIASVGAVGGSRLFQMLWLPLGDSTFRLVEWWLSFLYADSIVSDPVRRLLGTRRFYVEIAPQCSGYEGIGLISVLVLVFLAVFRQSLRFPRAWLLWPIGVATIWICNTLRITALIVIGTEYSSSVAMGGFHSQAGWILFNLVSLGLMTGALRSEFFARTVTRTVRPKSRVVPYLVPFMVLTALSMIIAATVDDAATLYPVTVVVSLSLLWMSRDVLRQLNWTWSPQALLYGVGVYVVWTGLAMLEAKTRSAESVPLPACDTFDGLAWTIIRVFGAVVTVPIIEELAFRGFFLRRLSQADFESAEYRNVSLWAVVVSSVAFGLLHQLWIGGVIAGLAYAWLTRQHGRLTDAIQAHAITNALLAVTVLWTGATWLW
jgi:exosortase E/protease (VPEID-CTERM system)